MKIPKEVKIYLRNSSSFSQDISLAVTEVTETNYNARPTMSLRNPDAPTVYLSPSKEPMKNAPIPTSIADWPIATLKKNRNWLVFQDHDWAYMQELIAFKQLDVSSDGVPRCLELLENNRWLSGMELHYFGKDRSINLVLKETLKTSTSPAENDETALLVIQITPFLLEASVRIGEVASEQPKKKEPEPILSREQAILGALIGWDLSNPGKTPRSAEWSRQASRVLGLTENERPVVDPPEELGGLVAASAALPRRRRQIIEDEDDSDEGLIGVEGKSPARTLSIVKTNDPAVLEFWLLRQPFTLFRES